MGNEKRMGPDDITLPRGPRTKHGGYTFIRIGKLPKNRQKIERYLTWVRQSYIEDIAGTEDNLTTGQTVLLNKLVMLEGLCRCIEIYQAQVESLDMPTKYLSYLNNIIKICQMLGIDRRDIKPDILTPAELAASVDADILKEKEGKK